MGKGLEQTAEVSAPGSGLDAAPDAALSVARLRLRPATLRFPFPLIIILAVGLVAAGQLAEDQADSPILEMFMSPIAIRRWSVVAAVLYMLVISEVLDRTVRRSRDSLKLVLQIDDARFAPYAVRMRRPDTRVDFLLLVVSALIVILLFVVLQLDLPVANNPRALDRLPDGLGSLVALAGYVIVGWAGLRLVYVTARLARVLGEMSHQPLAIDVFDTSNLLPFGNIALAVSLAPVGIIVILLLGLGQPATPLGWTVLALAGSASVLALLLPIRGAHRQMSRAKHGVLERLNARIREAYNEVTGSAAIEAPEMAQLTNRTSTLIGLRKTVQEMTTWPFRDTLAFGRAVVIASAPIIYAAATELIKILWFSPVPKP